MRSATCCWVQPRSMRAALSSPFGVACAAFLTIILLVYPLTQGKSERVPVHFLHYNSSITDVMANSHREFFAIWQAVFDTGGGAHMRSSAHSMSNLAGAGMRWDRGCPGRCRRKRFLIILSQLPQVSASLPGSGGDDARVRFSNNVQSATNAPESSAGQRQPSGSLRVANQLCVNAGSFHRIANLVVMDKTQPCI